MKRRKLAGSKMGVVGCKNGDVDGLKLPERG